MAGNEFLESMPNSVIFNLENFLFHCRKRLGAWAELVAFAHSLFMLPFMAAAILLVSAQAPISWFKIALIVAAQLSARHVAMLSNRLLDMRFDAQNPRTRGRGLVTGQVSIQEAAALLLANFLIFISACLGLNWLCLSLVPLALFIIIVYSYSKRFTCLCHLWLGTACALGPLGAWAGISANLSPSIWPLGLGCAFWVAGFDILYACQDMEFDRRRGLCSIPARYGREKAVLISRLLHAGAVLSFASLLFIFNLNYIYALACLFMAAGLFYQQFINTQATAVRFTCTNGAVALGYFAITLLAHAR
jgi:4-hydroxybenzoate polyprenyltransferase